MLHEHSERRVLVGEGLPGGENSSSHRPNEARNRDQRHHKRKRRSKRDAFPCRFVHAHCLSSPFLAKRRTNTTNAMMTTALSTAANAIVCGENIASRWASVSTSCGT